MRRLCILTLTLALAMAAVLYHFLTEEDFRRTVRKEHQILSSLFDQYLERLKETYGDEINPATPGQ